MGSRGQVVGRLERRSLDSCSSVSGVKEKEKRGLFAGGEGSLGSCVCNAEN